MSGVVKTLKDDGARRDAISGLDRSMLVEAGAGSGKTAVLAGRIALMLAEGIAPGAIAAVTFTELAASELLSRVRAYVSELAQGRIARELQIALPEGLDQTRLANLALASATIDELTCSTIHGFCQRLIKPYPAEANIDPGAVVMDRSQADLVFMEIVDTWLRERLSGTKGGILAELVLQSPTDTVKLIHKISNCLRGRRDLKAPGAGSLSGLVSNFQQATAAFSSFTASAAIGEAETAAWASHFAAMAAAIPTEQTLASPTGLVSLLVSRPHSDLCTASGSFYAYRKKGKWQAAAKQAGLSKTVADQLNDAADQHYSNCCAGWTDLLETLASTVLTALIAETQEVIDRFRKHKRDGAQLDFDDLIYAARDLLRDNEAVRGALGARYRHVLVDEFQDTDPLQTEIFWRLCGDPEGDSADWRGFRIRPGALFLVGDPKQAIYRFRGADVSAYTEARDTFQAARPDNVVAISTNFRSCKAILTFVNERFELVLSANGQPGFTPLDHVHEDRVDSICVAALDIAVADANGKAAAELQRDAEADAVADLCSRMIGSYRVTDRKSGTDRICQPGDIALLAPTGAELWRYEEALERRGIPVATQAGKGFYRRQEIQDLIAITRVLADRRDTLALGALLRGPMVGLTEEQLLDIVWSLPRSEAEPDRLPRLDLGVDPEAIGHPVGRDVIRTLQALYRRANSTTPYDLLSQAIDALRVRPLLLDRHRGQAERAMANVDLFLNLASSYSVRGLRAFAEATISAWTEEERAVEGRPDAQEDAVALYTMHAAKGLEWPVVIPINTMTKLMAGESAVIDRLTDTLYVPVMGVAPAGYEAVKKVETNELDRERVRLWYVAATRARELLVVPRLDAPPARGPAWISLIDLRLETLPAIDLSHLPNEIELALADHPNGETREIFAAGAQTIAAGRKIVNWLAPSRGENVSKSIQDEASTEIWVDTTEGVSPPLNTTAIQGGRERGLILHKLLEEVISGELADSTGELIRRATDLIGVLGMIPGPDASKQLSPAELADCVCRTLALPEINRLRSDLLAEYPVYGSTEAEHELIVRAGIADAVTLNSSGKPSTIIDWKSDVQPDIGTLDHYRAQVGDYLMMTGAETGLIVLVSSGTVISVPRPANPSQDGAER